MWVIELQQGVWGFFWADENVLTLNSDNDYTVLYSKQPN